MANFKGTYKEFKTHCMASITNKVQSIAKKEKEKRNYICENCDKDMSKDKLNYQAAHFPKSRINIVEEILEEYKVGEIISCDLNKIQKKFIKIHTPITKICKFVCKDCHNTKFK
jgi:hypothetical protein